MKDYTFGNMIANLRTARGYSQFQLGMLLGVSDKAISKWENGDAKPRLATCARLAEILGVSVNELLTTANSANTGATAQEAVMIKDQRRKRLDASTEKRVELHLHTGMTGEDSFGSVSEYLEIASAWGLNSIAVTDRFVTHAFPQFSRFAMKTNIKPIYGCELWLIPEPDSDWSEGCPIMALVKNRHGLVNLNRLVSDSHTKYLKYGTPCVPRVLVSQMRDGLLIGAACNGGEINRALRDGKNCEELEELIAFYDYLEVQPPECESYDNKDINLIQRVVRDTISLGVAKGIPVVAVGNVHFIEPDESILSDALRYNSGETDCQRQIPLYFRTTEEMLDSFNFLDIDTAQKIVITNTQTIAACIDEGISLYPDLPEGRNNYYPMWPKADTELTQIVMDKARALYGDSLPQVVSQRMERELQIIKGNNFATLYMIVRSVVRKSIDSGYPVMSRGAMASSLITMLCGIDDINPLPPHYRCPNCLVSDFEVDTNKYKMGADLPSRKCPECGKEMVHDGFNIPFETFLGQHGERVPDFDLNLVPEYQKEAHKYAANLFGMNHGLVAGTISGYSDRAVESLIMRYAEDHDIPFDREQVDKYKTRFYSVRRYTGQHPGGVVLIPSEYEAVDFTPVQYPADDESSPVMTTHYDFISMHDVLLKLDLLSHDTPTLLRKLKMMVGIDIDSIPLDDPKVMALFTSTEALGVHEEDILSKTGTYGIPEFNTMLARKMLKQLQPKSFAELVAISGLLHGTDVWFNNAEELYKSGVATLLDCPAHREDIMDKLIAHGIDRDIAYRTMESVRKGRGVPSNLIPVMKAAGIPNWYINICQKIRYMFPRTHAVSYVVNSVRLAWFKLYYPNEFYTAWMSILVDDSEPGDLTMDVKGLRHTILSIRDEELTPFSERAREQALEMYLEMRVRGISPVPELNRKTIYQYDAIDGEMQEIENLIMNKQSPLISSIYLTFKERRIDYIRFIQTRIAKGISANDILAEYLDYLKSEDANEQKRRS